MFKFVELFLVAALWSPGIFFGSYIANSGGRTSLGQATTVEWIIFLILMIVPYFVLAKIKPRDNDE